MHTAGIRNLTGLFTTPENQFAGSSWRQSGMGTESDFTPPECMVQLPFGILWACSAALQFVVEVLRQLSGTLLFWVVRALAYER